MKKVLGVFLAIVLMPASQVQAWIGGPFSNNSYFTNGDDGIYEAYATLQNGTGLFRFAVRNNGTSSESAAGAVNGMVSSNVMFSGGLLQSVSSCFWYFRGVTYAGPCVGIANSEMGIVSAIGNAQSNTISNPASTTGINGISIAGPQGQNIDFANSSWTAKIKQKFPIVRFNGSGTVTFTGDVDTFTRTTTTTVAIPDGTIVTTVTSSGGESSVLGQIGKRRKFLVFGSRVSTTVIP